MCMCVCVYVYVCMCVCVHVYVYVHVCVFVSVRMYMCTRVICMYTRVHRHIYIYICITYICTYVHTYIRLHTGGLDASIREWEPPGKPGLTQNSKPRSVMGQSPSSTSVCVRMEVRKLALQGIVTKTAVGIDWAPAGEPTYILSHSRTYIHTCIHAYIRV